MKEAEDIILYGGREGLDRVIEILGKVGGFRVREIWDSDSSKEGKAFLVNEGGEKVSVCTPRYGCSELPVVITSSLFAREIKEMLIHEFGIHEQMVKSWWYCFHNVKDEIIKKYSGTSNFEIQNTLKYLEQHELTVFLVPKLSVSEYEPNEFEVSLDTGTGLYYSYWKGKKIYLKRSIDSEIKARSYLWSICDGQKHISPHCYQQDGFEITNEDVILDGGAAEGFFALEHIDVARKVFLAEGDKEWVEALRETFRPYQDKAVIIPGWLGKSKPDEMCTTIDLLDKHEEITFIKLDIEGTEPEALKGAVKTLQGNRNLRIMACTYHNSCESSAMARLLLDLNYAVRYTKGYMFFPYGETIEPELRRGLLLAKKTEKTKILIWGAGKMAEVVCRAVNQEKCEIIGIVDKDITKVGRLWNGQYKIYAPQSIEDIKYDTIVISLKNHAEEVMAEGIRLGISKDNFIDFWNEDVPHIDFIDWNIRQIEKMEQRISEYELRIENMPYELGMSKVPMICPAAELLCRIAGEKVSLCRFGDGEFEIMRGNERPWFQQPDAGLAARLKEVIHSDEKGILIAIADNFGNLDKYTEKSADGIRQYLCDGTREAVMGFLDDGKVYYDAYVSRPYIIYKDKTYAAQIFSLFKKIWRDRDIVIVEGENSRLGIGNDLFSEVKSIRRILCPARNAFMHYDEILKNVLEEARQGDLVLISLGPTATVLAYDVARTGIQALDIGQIDNEYEWYLMGTAKREEIPGKVVAEISWCHNPQEVKDRRYYEQTVRRICAGD